jgi:hypothetical protein
MRADDDRNGIDMLTIDEPYGGSVVAISFKTTFSSIIVTLFKSRNIHLEVKSCTNYATARGPMLLPLIR